MKQQKNPITNPLQFAAFNIYNMKPKHEVKILITYTNEFGVSVTAKVTQEHLNRLAQIYTVYLIK